MLLVSAALLLTTSTAVPLPAGATVLLDGGRVWQLLGHLVLQAGHPDQEALLVDGLLQGFDVGLHLLLHALSEAAEVAAPCRITPSSSFIDSKRQVRRGQNIRPGNTLRL